MSSQPGHVIKEFRIVHMSFGKIYRYKHLIFEHHDYCGPQFLRHKDHEAKDMRHATGRNIPRSVRQGVNDGRKRKPNSSQRAGTEFCMAKPSCHKRYV